MPYNPVPFTDKMIQESCPDFDSYCDFMTSYLMLGVCVDLRKIRKKQGISQGKLAKLMGSHKSVISRLESDNDDAKHSPSLSTLTKAAAALGYKIEISFVPDKSRRAFLKKQSKKTKKPSKTVSTRAAANDADVSTRKKPARKYRIAAKPTGRRVAKSK